MDFSNPPLVRASAAQAGFQAAEVARALAAYGSSVRTPPPEHGVPTSDEDARPHADAEGTAPPYRPSLGRGRSSSALSEDAERGRLLDVWA